MRRGWRSFWQAPPSSGKLTGDPKMAASWASEAGSEAGRMIVDPSHTKVKDG